MEKSSQLARALLKRLKLHLSFDQTSTVKAQQYRIVSVAEADDFTLGVTALEYNPDIYAAVESNIQLTTSITTS